MKSYQASEEHLQHALRWTPGGSQTGSKAPGKAGPLGQYPAFASWGKGCWALDVDEHRYLDFIAGLAAIGIAHAEPSITHRVWRMLDRGTIFSLPHMLESIVAEKLCKFIGQPWAEQVRWVKSGSEACEAAARIARKATGRSLILTVDSGYHGWHSWFQASKPEHPGVPEDYEHAIAPLPYGDRETWERWLRFKEPAAVMLEAAPITGRGSADFLQWLRDETQRAGALLIFDEVVWGFRLAPAGGSEYFGVMPDLACYGKALGNGVPIAGIVGPREIMSHATVISGTYGGDLIGLAAADAVLDLHEGAGRKGLVNAMWDRGNQLCSGLSEIASSVYPAFRFAVKGYAVHPVLAIDSDNPTVAMSLLLQELAEREILWHHGGVNIMSCMQERDISFALKQFAAAAESVADSLKLGREADALRGEPYQQAFARAR